MKRIHLFEFEDQSWFPKTLRICMTRLITVMHKLLGTHSKCAVLLNYMMEQTQSHHIVDLCSGSGGPMLEIRDRLEQDYDHEQISLTLTDLYPDLTLAVQLNQNDAGVKYVTKPVPAETLAGDLPGIRTIIAGFHHMKPETAKSILRRAQEQQQPLFIFEISDNSAPPVIRWISFPINLIMTFFVTLGVRPMTWQQIVFTYLIPILPITFAWDGAVSNMRTYTLSDLDELLAELPDSNYTWQKGTTGSSMKQIYIIGLPDKPETPVPVPAD